MKEKLVIKNFGPIKSVDLDLGKITVLIGEQATGKSTISKVLSVCRYFSYIVDFSDNTTELLKFTENQQFIKALKNWGIEGYLKKDSYFFYHNENYDFEFKNELIVEYENVAPGDDVKKEYFKANTRIKVNSESFKELLVQLQQLKIDDENYLKDAKIKMFYFDGWNPNENFYRLNVKKIMDNPLFIPAERSLQSTAFSKGLLISDAELDALGKLSRIAIKFKKTKIEPLSLTYKNENNIGYIRKNDEDNYYKLYQSASGYKAIIPIVLAVEYYNEIERRKKTFIIEEPELNLFPKVQKKLVEFFAKSINEFDNQILLPTHSPYILTTLSNLIYAHKIGTSNKEMFQKEVDKIIPKESWIDVKDVSVYYLNKGTAKNLVNIEECLINVDDLDNVSETINSDFDKLLEIEMALEKEITE